MSEYMCDRFAFEQEQLAHELGLDEQSGAYDTVYYVVVNKGSQPHNKGNDQYDCIYEGDDPDEAYEVMNEYKHKHPKSIVSIESREFYRSIYA